MGIEVIIMRISNLIQPGMPDFEERKRALQRKEMGEAYKKTAKFVEVSKNPMFAVLENLLSGKAEKDLLATDEQLSDETIAFNESIIRDPQIMAIAENEDIEQERLLAGESSNTSTPTLNNKHYNHSGEVVPNNLTGTTQKETIQILEQVKQAALAPANPSEQDLRIAASASAQIEQTAAELRGETVEFTEEYEPFIGEDLTVDIPNRFMNEFKRDAAAPTIFGKEFESLISQRIFNKVVETYTTHIAMVKNGYRSINEPSFSKIA